MHESNRPFSKAIELRDDDNCLLTQNEKGRSCLLAAVARGGKMDHMLYIKRYYGHKNPLNTTLKCHLTQNMNVHSVSQVCKTQLAVSMDFHLELFDALTGTRSRIIKTDTLFQFIVRVNQLDFNFGMSEKFRQEVCIGFNNGSFTSLGIADSAAPGEAEMKGSRRMWKNQTVFKGIEMLNELLDKEVARGLNKRKILA